MHKLLVGLFYRWGFGPAWHQPQCRMHRYGRETQRSSRLQNDGSILVPSLDILVSIFTLGSPVKSFSFSCKLGNRLNHNARIIFNKASVELCQSIESLNGLDIFRGGILTKAAIFFGSENLPAWQTM